MIRSSTTYVTLLLPTLLATRVVEGAAAQSDTDSLAAQTDAVFAQWDKPDSPGCVCAVMRAGEIIYSRGYGMANLEHDIPLTPQSVFYIASTSKQFTAASIALLALRGELSLDDDIRTYVPEMADFGETVTIRHLVHHTSGIRDYFGLAELAGWTDKDYFNNDRTLALLSHQRTLNFAPGAEYLYSNSGYVLLAEIVKRASGKSLSEYAHDNIFAPLGMSSTHFDDNYRTIVKHRAASYGQEENGEVFRYLKAFDGVGDGNLLTTVEDLAQWDRNFYDMKVGGPEFIELILTQGTLNNDETIDYAFGLGHGDYRGLRTVGHTGGFKGFRTQLLRFPEQRFSVAVLCNLGSTSPFQLAQQVADIYLSDVLEQATVEEPSRPTRESVAISEPALQRVTGHYWNPQDNFARRIYVKDDTLMYFRGPGNETKLAPLGDDRFFMLDAPVDVTVSFTQLGTRKERQMIVVVDEGDPIVFDGFQPFEPSASELEVYAGTYSGELDSDILLRVQKDTLIVWYPRNLDDVTLEPVMVDVFQASGYTVRFLRDAGGGVSGFTVDAGRIRNLKFAKR